MARPRAGMSKQAKCTLLLQTCVRFHLLYFLFVGIVRIYFHNARNNKKKSLLNNVSKMMEDREIAKNVQEDVKSWNSINKFSDTHKKRKQTPYLIQWTTTEWELILRELKLNCIVKYNILNCKTWSEEFAMFHESKRDMNPCRSHPMGAIMRQQKKASTANGKWVLRKQLPLTIPSIYTSLEHPK